MGWEMRGPNGPYYTRSTRVNGRVVRSYVGGGPAGIRAAQADAKRRAERQKLRMAAQSEMRTAEQMDQLRQPQELPADEQRPLRQALEQLRQELQQQTADDHDPDGPLAQIVLTHLDKYWEHLVPDPRPAAGQPWPRTTNQLESDWGTLKRRRRQTHGRGKLTRDFQSLPEEYPLVRNLENETYLQVVLGGSLESLPAKLAEASRVAGSFDQWRRRRRPRLNHAVPDVAPPRSH